MDSDHQMLQQRIQVWAADDRGTTCPTCLESQTVRRIHRINCLTTSLGMNSKRLGFFSLSRFLVVTALMLMGSVARAGMSLLVQPKMEFTPELKVQLAPACQLAPGLHPALQGQWM